MEKVNRFFVFFVFMEVLRQFAQKQRLYYLSTLSRRDYCTVDYCAVLSENI